MSVNLSKHSAIATSARPEDTGGRGVLNVGHGQSGQAEFLHGLDAQHRCRLDVADERLVDVGQGQSGVVQRQQPGIAGQVCARRVLEHAEADHADTRHCDAVETQAVLHAAWPPGTGLKR
jgi:hypothetical protein